jgi:uncharacterized alkaline shock family protein YloU
VTTTATAATLPTAEVPAAATRTALVSERGVTTIAPVVAEKIAARAASEVDGVAGLLRPALRGLLPWTHSATPSGPASADATIDDGSVTVHLTVNVRYPRPVGAVAAQVRDRVTSRLGELCGLHVERVDIFVPELVAETHVARRRVE